MASLVTGIEHLSKTRNTYTDELSFANQGLKLLNADDGNLILACLLTDFFVMNVRQILKIYVMHRLAVIRLLFFSKRNR